MTIKVITNRDKELFSQLARTSLITKEQAFQYLGYSKDGKRLNQLTKAGYLKKVIYKGQQVYRIASLAKTYVKDHIPAVGHFYNGVGGFDHDYKLTEQYYEKYYEFRDTWKTEQDYKVKGSQGTPDATITRADGVIVAIEIVTSNYTQDQIEAKTAFAAANRWEFDRHDS